MLVSVEAPNFARNAFDGSLAAVMSMCAQAIDQGLLTELFSRGDLGFGYPIGVEGEQIAGIEVAFRDRVIAITKNP